jgi:hypothetical protein
MRTLSAAELLEAWERGSRQHPVDRALTLLTVWSAETWDALAVLSVGRRDALLLQMYQELFGPALDAFAECPQCGAPLEYRLSTRDLLATPSRAEPPAEVTVSDGASWLRLRPPNCLDLRAVAQCVDLTAARRSLLERCVVAAAHDGTAVPVAELPAALVERAAACLAAADPQAELLIDLRCPACRHPWQVLLDIESFLWAKVSALAKRLLREVHVLAQAYGWREADILALSATRRQLYLEMVRA